MEFPVTETASKAAAPPVDLGRCIPAVHSISTGDLCVFSSPFLITQIQITVR